MIELPEALCLSQKITDHLLGKTITYAKANSSPHGFAWYYGNPDDYGDFLVGQSIVGARPSGGMLDILLSGGHLVFGDGAPVRFWEAEKKTPAKHQLHIKFDDDTSLTTTIQMYGGIWAFAGDWSDNGYYQGGLTHPSPLTDTFDFDYFKSLYDEEKDGKLSAKAFLATHQRIPGFGNGVLHDILWRAQIHPRRAMNTLGEDGYFHLYNTLKSTLAEMANLGGRDTEKDLFGNPGGYKTALSRMNKAGLCPKCGAIIVKEQYLGGAIYWCPNCQLR